MKLFNLFLMAVFCLSFLSTSSLATDETCIISSPSQPGTHNGNDTYDVKLSDPVRVSSIDVGFQNSGCAAATFTSMSERSNLLGTNGLPETRDNIIDACVLNGGVTRTSSDPLDRHIAGLITMLQKDPKFCYKLTIKSIEGRAHLPPITILPPPQKTVLGNVEKIVYDPYNPQISDIVEAIRKVSSSKGGVGMTGKSYEGGIEKDHHMFQPIAINTVPSPGNLTEKSYSFKVYDPLHSTDIDVSIVFDAQGRLYTNIWERRGAQVWFHIENLVSLENLGPCLRNNTNLTTNSTLKIGSPVGEMGYYYNPFPPSPPIRSFTPVVPRGPHTPIPCGPKIANMCQRAAVCPQNEYCNADLNCMCKEKICGDRVVDPGEECDGGSGSSQNPSQCPNYPNICIGCKCLILPEPPIFK